MFTGPVQDLVEELSKLPGIGPKTAQRLAFHILKTEDVDAKRLAEAILEVKDKMRFCGKCFNVSTTELCEFCSDPRRDATLVCVVEEPRDIWAIEKTAEFRGRYHVLGGAISPIDGIGPDQLHISELIERLEPDGIKEIIVATNPNVEGDATAIYIARLIGPLGVEVSRISSGLPVGGDLEYADEVTLGRALEGRRRM
ncbi:MAG: recombination mediator RecR [Actinobacteria bacterium]|nr:recombination mediator RecR [Actinomycetota bacterium]